MQLTFKIFKKLSKVTLVGVFTMITYSSHGTMNQDKEDTYALATDIKAATRLDLQNDLLKLNSYEHLKKAGLSQGQIVCDVGCGNGAMTVYLAQQVGCTGQVYAIDTSQEQLDLAADKVKSAGLNNVIFLKSDVRIHQDFLINVADLVYMRYVLMHIKNPEEIIRDVKNLLKKNGVVVSQESIMDTCYSSSHHKVFCEYKKALLAMAKALGVDYNIGNKLEQLYERAGFIEITKYEIQQKIDLATTKDILIRGLNEWKSKAINLNVFTENEAKILEEVIANWPNDDVDFFYALANQAYVIAEK